MDVSIAKKFKIEIRIIAIICIINIVLLFLIFAIWYSISGLERKIQTQEKQLSIYMKKFTTGQSATIEAKESQKSRLKLEYNQLKNTLSSSDESSYAKTSSLDFKQKLFDIQEDLTAKAKEKNMIISKFIGFEDYELNVPEDSLSGLLIKELYITEEVINSLIKNNVLAIKRIKLPHEKTKIEYGSNGTGSISFESFSMELSIEINYQDFKQFLAQLSKSSRIYILWQLSAKSEDAQAKRLIVDLKLKTVEL